MDSIIRSVLLGLLWCSCDLWVFLDSPARRSSPIQTLSACILPSRRLTYGHTRRFSTQRSTITTVMGSKTLAIWFGICVHHTLGLAPHHPQVPGYYSSVAEIKRGDYSQVGDSTSSLATRSSEQVWSWGALYLKIFRPPSQFKLWQVCRSWLTSGLEWSRQPSALLKGSCFLLSYPPWLPDLWFP